MNDIIIIGCGPVGLYGAILSSLHNLKGIVIESLNQIGGQLTSLYPEKDIIDLPGFDKIKAKDFISKLESQYNSKENKLPIHLNESVLDIIKEEDYYLVKTTLDTYETKTILLTTGMGMFSPRLIGLENEKEIKNIFYSCSDVSIYKDKDVIVLGGGDSAVDLSLLINKVAKSTTIIHRRNDFRAQESSVRKMSEEGICILRNHSIKGIDQKEDKIRLTIKDNETLKESTLTCDNVLVQYGQIPSKDSFPVEKENNLIKVNDYYQTSLPNVFACGNIVTYKGKVKNIITGLGEVSLIITRIDQIINPTKNIPIHF